MYNIDALYETVSAKGHVCIGMDTSAAYIPPLELQRASSDTQAVLNFNRAIIDATADIAACYKVQIAYYEALGRAGLDIYAQTLAYIRKKKSLVIADIKRGDIADTAAQYAKAHFEGDFEADFVTLSPYMGMDSIEPWLSCAESKGKGAFVLLRTSNKGMCDFQNLKIVEKMDSTECTHLTTEDGCPLDSVESHGDNSQKLCVTPCNSVVNNEKVTKIEASVPPMRLYHAVGDKLSALAERHRGNCGYGAFGAVVGADPKTGEEREEAIAIRSRYKNLFFLIPGFGAQGGAAEDAALLLREGNGGVVNASRSILKAWTSADKAGEAGYSFAAEAAREAAVTMRDAIQRASR